MPRWFLRFVLLSLAAEGGFGASPNTSTGVENPPRYDSMLPPAAGSSYVDPVFGTVIKRITNAPFTSDAVDGGNLTWIENEYSTVAAYNSDDSYFILVHQSYYGLYSGDGKFVRNLPFEMNSSSEPRWSRKDNVTLYYHVNNILKSYNITSGAITVIHAFSEYSSISGRGESDISHDGDHFVFVGDNRYVFVYQLSTNTKFAALDTTGQSFDGIAITPRNNVIISWIVSGNVRFTGEELFDANMNFLRQIDHADGHKHTTLYNGNEVLVWNNSADPQPIANCQNGIVLIQLKDASQTCLMQLDWSLAVHVTAPDNAGLAFFETYAPSDPAPGTSAWVPYTNELIRVGLSPTTATYRLAHHRSQPRDSYLYQPKMTVSRDGLRLLYASNFDLQQVAGYPTDYADTYMIALRPWSSGQNAPQQTSVTTTAAMAAAPVTRYDHSNPAVTFTGKWISTGASAAAMDAGAKAQFTFTGSSVSWIGSSDSSSGIANIYLDGKLVSIIDTYSPGPAASSAQFTMHNTGAGAHTLTIMPTGTKRDASRGTWVSVGEFDVGN